MNKSTKEKLEKELSKSIEILTKECGAPKHNASDFLHLSQAALNLSQTWVVLDSMEVEKDPVVNEIPKSNTELENINEQN